MKFERLSVPHLPMPDLVAFNRRVHERIDPWWSNKWVRRVAWAGVALFALFAAMWIYFAAGLPSSQTLLAYQPPLPTNVRGYDGNPVQPESQRIVHLSQTFAYSVMTLLKCASASRLPAFACAPFRARPCIPFLKRSGHQHSAN